jgi:hypothetical protein
MAIRFLKYFYSLLLYMSSFSTKTARDNLKEMCFCLEINRTYLLNRERFHAAKIFSNLPDGITCIISLSLNFLGIKNT